MMVGHDASCDFRLTDQHISRQHFSIYQKDDSYYIQDLRSLRGTFVNSMRLTEPKLLEIGSGIRIGDTSFIWAENAPNEL